MFLRRWWTPGNRSPLSTGCGLDPPQVYQPEPEQHEHAIEEVGTALGYGISHDPHRFDKPFRRRDGERLTWVHIPVFRLATKTSAAFCNTVMAAVMLATPTGP